MNLPDFLPRNEMFMTREDPSQNFYYGNREKSMRRFVKKMESDEMRRTTTSNQQNNSNSMNYDEEAMEQVGRRKFRDPYTLNPKSVHIYHFKDARVFDPEAEGFEFQRWCSKKMYCQWLRTIRSQPGWEGFRRPPKVVFEEVEQEDGTVVIKKKIVPYSKFIAADALRNATGGTNPKSFYRTTVALSKDKGVRPDDHDFRPKMFTPKMGQYISQLRNTLKMTQAELGKSINVDASTIRNIELGDLVPFNPEDMMVKSLARVLGIPSIKYN